MNPKDFPNLQSRRDFFRHAACAAVGTISMATMIRDMRLINAAAAQQNFTDYKALVCIFLAGGSDMNNLVVPLIQAEYDNYSAIRKNLALPRLSEMQLNIASADRDGHDYFFHPACSGLPLGTAGAPTGGLWKLFDEGKVATVFNVGPLVYPLTVAQYKAKSVPTPPQLFSHSDQVTHWQTSLPDQPPRTGWGGRIADLLHPQQLDLQNDGTKGPNAAKIALCTSIAGANTFEVGDLPQYHVSTSGAVTLSGISTSQKSYVQNIIAASRPNLQAIEYGRVMKNAMDIGDTLNTAISATDPTAFPNYWSTPFPKTSTSNSLGSQLRMVARLIKAAPSLNMKRQIFFCQVGGYDTHTGQIGTTLLPDDTTVGSHANLLNELSEAMFAFQRAMEQIGMSNSVTSFTASDFGRTFPTNGQGSDHGWGSHHLVMGGAVKGRKTYGTFPVQQVNGPDDTGIGRWIPKISVDQYSATLASWFGVDDNHMSTVFPNLGHFSPKLLPFL